MIYKLLFLLVFSLQAKEYTYKKIEDNNHIIHVVYLPPNSYTPRIVKAEKGRETVSSIADRYGSKIAINGGFFNSDGSPSFTLIIDGNVYKKGNTNQPLLVIDSGKISIINDNPTGIYNKTISILSGIPLLVKDGEVVEHSRESDFYVGRHARTAIGIDKNNTIIVVVVEHYYLRDHNKITLAELNELLQKNRKNVSNMTYLDIQKFVKDYCTDSNKTQGLTIKELSLFMKNLGCNVAINLDGGGSSTLWINGKIINEVIGDKDESNGNKVERPVSDALLFNEKIK